MMKSISLSQSMMVADDVDYVFVEEDDADDDLSFVEKEELEGFPFEATSYHIFPPMSPERGNSETHNTLLVLGANYAHNKCDAADSMSAKSAMVSDDEDEDDVDESMTIADSVANHCPSNTKSDQTGPEDMEIDEPLKNKNVSSSAPNPNVIGNEIDKKFGQRRLSKKKQRAAARKMKKILSGSVKQSNEKPDAHLLIDQTQKRLSNINKKMKVPV